MICTGLVPLACRIAEEILQNHLKIRRTVPAPTRRTLRDGIEKRARIVELGSLVGIARAELHPGPLEPLGKRRVLRALRARARAPRARARRARALPEHSVRGAAHPPWLPTGAADRCGAKAPQASRASRRTRARAARRARRRDPPGDAARASVPRDRGSPSAASGTIFTPTDSMPSAASAPAMSAACARACTRTAMVRSGAAFLGRRCARRWRAASATRSRGHEPSEHSTLAAASAGRVARLGREATRRFCAHVICACRQALRSAHWSTRRAARPSGSCCSQMQRRELTGADALIADAQEQTRPRPRETGRSTAWGRRPRRACGRRPPPSRRVSASSSANCRDEMS